MNQSDSLTELSVAAERLDVLLEDYLADHRSPRLVNARAQLGYVRVAIEREAGKLVEEAEREERRRANAADRAIRMEYTEHERAMAAGGKVKLPGDGYVIRTPAEFRAVVTASPRPQTKAELDALMADQA